MSFINRKKTQTPVIQYQEFIPFQSKQSSLRALQTFTTLAIEELTSTKNVSIIEIDDNVKKLLMVENCNFFKNLPSTYNVEIQLNIVSGRDAEELCGFEKIKSSAVKEKKIVIASNCLNHENSSQFQSYFKDEGFLISREIDFNIHDFKLPEKFKLLSSVEVGNEFIVMLKYENQNVRKAKDFVVIEMSENDHKFEWVAKCQEIIETHKVILVAQNEPLSGILGFFKCLKTEYKDICCFFIVDKNASKFDLSNEFYNQQFQLGLSINVLKDGKWGSYRYFDFDENHEINSTNGHYYLNNMIKSDLSSLKWIEGPIKSNQSDIVKVQYAALNFRDIMLATGKISPAMFYDDRKKIDSPIGLEYSGVTQNGLRVMGLTSPPSFSTIIQNPSVQFNVPENWTLEEAGTVPVVYATVYLAFFDYARIIEGKSILIHAGSGGIGFAAITIAFAYGLEVFTTVSSEEKRQYLLDNFPQLKPENIGNSRETSFKDLVMTRTCGKGVDYLLNSLADDKLQASIECLGKRGHFLEIGKFDIQNDSKIGLRNFAKGISFHSIVVNEVEKNEIEPIKLKLERDLEQGIIKPLKSNVFMPNEAEKAFRFMASAKHIGKVLIKIRENENDEFSLPMSIVPRVHFNPENSYIMPGGLGGMGLEIADWMVLRGCRKLVLSSSRGITNGYQNYRIKIWKSYGVQVIVNTADITTRWGCQNLINDAIKLGPVGGIFNLAVQLRDGLFKNQTPQKFIESMGPKALATKYLDEISRVMCPELQYFVVFSSVACGLGNMGQTNYGMANSVMERIIEQRHILGLPSKAIQWGPVDDVGIVAENNFKFGSLMSQPIASCIEVMDKIMSSKCPIMMSGVLSSKTSKSEDASLFDTLMNILGVSDTKSVSQNLTLSQLGLDSLMVVEIRQLLERDFNLVLTSKKIEDMTVQELSILSKNSKCEKSSETGNN